MIIFKKIVEFKNYLRKLKNKKKKIGFIPTMGALHDGHFSLISRSLSENDLSIISIFINPTQFNNQNDLFSYPSDLKKDINSLKIISENLILFNPSSEEIYSGNIVSNVFSFGGLDKYMEGKFRKNHFQGVATILQKLFDLVKPDNVYFGEKDFQQLRIVEYFVSNLGFNLNIIRCKTIRTDDGLALSSRNKKLDISSQKIATNLFKALNFVKENFDTLNFEKIYNKVRHFLSESSEIKIEYFIIADEKDLKPIKTKDKNKKYRAFIAADVSGVRLIDNIKLY